MMLNGSRCSYEPRAVFCYSGNPVALLPRLFYGSVVSNLVFCLWWKCLVVFGLLMRLVSRLFFALC